MSYPLDLMLILLTSQREAFTLTVIRNGRPEWMGRVEPGMQIDPELIQVGDVLACLTDSDAAQGIEFDFFTVTPGI